jgi:hypothetical protein
MRFGWHHLTAKNIYASFTQQHLCAKCCDQRCEAVPFLNPGPGKRTKFRIWTLAPAPGGEFSISTPALGGEGDRSCCSFVACNAIEGGHVCVGEPVVASFIAAGVRVLAQPLYCSNSVKRAGGNEKISVKNENEA